MISIAAVKRDFAKLISVKREVNVKFAANRDFHYVFVIFDNGFCAIVTSRLIPVATTWLVWGTYHLHGKTGNRSWKIKWFGPFRLESFRKYGM